MNNTFLHKQGGKASSNHTSTRSEESSTFSDVVAQAETCCEQARIAGRQRRYKAAYGLFSTALALYKRATLLDGVSYVALEARVHEVEGEMSVYSELAKSMARPLNTTAMGTSQFMKRSTL